MCRSFRLRAASPAPFLEQPLHILPSCSHQCFTVHLPELSQAKAPHAMPILALGKYRFHPDAALAHGLLIRLGPMVGADSLQILLIETASEGSTALTVRAVCFERAGIAHGMRIVRIPWAPAFQEPRSPAFEARVTCEFGE
jgi:hypothetical protein